MAKGPSLRMIGRPNLRVVEGGLGSPEACERYRASLAPFLEKLRGRAAEVAFLTLAPSTFFRGPTFNETPYRELAAAFVEKLFAKWIREGKRFDLEEAGIDHYVLNTVREQALPLARALFSKLLNDDSIEGIDWSRFGLDEPTPPPTAA